MYSLILLSAGKGIRVGKSTPKQYLPLGGKPMIIHILERVDKIDKINDLIIVAENEYFDLINDYLKKYNINKKISLVEGGDTRQSSVYNGIMASKNDSVIIHEAARPFVSIKDFNKLIDCNYDNVTCTYPIAFTVLKKDKDSCISELLDRNELVNIQLPQKFNRSELLFCHQEAKKQGKIFTEDASMLKYYLDKAVYCLEGCPYNIKITEYVDLLVGEILYKEYFLNEVNE